MDLLIAPYTVPKEQADAAPATGTPGWATDGNPATNKPATQWPAYAFNAMQEELASVIVGGGQILDRNDNTLLLKAILALTQQASTPIGTAANLKCTVSSAAASAPFVADEVVVGSTLGGRGYRVANFNKTVNLATTGAGGMDTGTAPNNGFVAVYAIYNPTTGASALLARNATAAAQPTIYGGANMPAGYTASALISVWPTNASGQFKVAFQRGRRVSFAVAQFLSTTTATVTLTPLAITVVPLNAVSMSGLVVATSNTGGNLGVGVAADSTGMGFQNTNSDSTRATGNFNLDILTAQNIYFSTSGTGTANFTGSISSYVI